MDELRELLSEHESGGLSVHKQLLLLRALRKTRLRRSDVTLAIGQNVINRNAANEEETWNIHEQVLIAALDLANLQLAEEYLSKLQKRFPGSSRVKRLQGMVEEAKGNFDEATRLYDELLEENPANLLVLKRKISILKAQGRTSAAITELNNLIKTFQCDESSWLELGELYVSAGDYSSAAFCYEELVILQPSNHITHTRLAEIYYTLGGVENFIKARRHYAQSLDIQRQHNLRAVIGLHTVCEALLALPQSGKHGLDDKQREITERMHELSIEETRPDANIRLGMSRAMADTVAAAFSS